MKSRLNRLKTCFDADMDIRLKTYLIIMRDREYLVGVNPIMRCLDWSVSPYHAWRTRNRKSAEMVARRVGGRLCLFNPVAAQTKELEVGNNVCKR